MVSDPEYITNLNSLCLNLHLLSVNHKAARILIDLSILPLALLLLHIFGIHMTHHQNTEEEETTNGALVAD